MSKEPNKKIIGLFVVVGFVALMALAGQSIWKKWMTDKRDTVVMYFQESIKGLNVGSPVMLHGVEIGKVTRIELVGHPKEMTFTAPVYAQLRPMYSSEKNISFLGRKSSLDIFIEKGLRARLGTQNFLTGQLMIELVMRPESEIQLQNSPYDLRHEIPEIPTVLSPTGALSQSLTNMPIRSTLEKLEKILDSLGQQLPVMLPALSETTQNLAKISAQLSPDADQTLDNLNRTLQDVSMAANAFRNLADYLERHPESLLKGKK